MGDDFIPFYDPCMNKKSSRGFIVISLALLLIVLLGILLGIYLYRLNTIVVNKFEGKRWEVPAKVYAKPLVLSIGAAVDQSRLLEELVALGYRPRENYELPGTYHVTPQAVFVHTRGFNYGNQVDLEQTLKIAFAVGKIANIETTATIPPNHIWLEPQLIGGIYPSHNEDRILLQYQNIPQPLIDALLATEDRTFFSHHGVSIRGITRSFINNIRGGAQQGGSTLTQQLVKNFYLTSDRKLKRKINEALMAILLEMQYSKQEILAAYTNEIDLGQNGVHSINGFALAAQFYFNAPLKELKLSQIALLVGLAKSASAYNPWAHPEAALKRRNLVLNQMVKYHKITPEQGKIALAAKLGVVKQPSVGKNLYPDFLDLVKRQLKNKFHEEDITSNGLNIFTTLDPHVQQVLSTQFNQSVAKLRTQSKRTHDIQGAAAIMSPQTGELLAVIGGADRFTGFNRAIDAKRQVGSLLKPVVYLTALESELYTLISPINDDTITITTNELSASTNRQWTPKNYDGTSHGNVPLYSALANSYNQATVRLGWQLGIPLIVNHLNHLGIHERIQPYPSLVLGAINLSVLDMVSMYQTFAAQGAGREPFTIRTITNETGQILYEHDDSVEQRISPAPAYLINWGLQQVVRSGTAAAINTSIDPTLGIAGKTGTTNDLRDAWFAGYSGNYVAVVWIGNDNNSPIGLSGSSGALPIWINIMKSLPLQAVNVQLPIDVIPTWVSKENGWLSGDGCEEAMLVPLLIRTVPTEITECGREKARDEQDEQSEPGTEIPLEEDSSRWKPLTPSSAAPSGL